MSTFRFRIFGTAGAAEGFINQTDALFLLPAESPGHVADKGHGQPVQTDHYTGILTNGTEYACPVFAEDVSTIWPAPQADPTVDALPPGVWEGYIPP